MTKVPDICEMCMIFCDKYPYDVDILSYDVYEMNKDWRKIFIEVCKRWGFTKSNAKFLYRNLGYGNWEHLHKNREESNYNFQKWFEIFRADVFYCSDRWNLDKLLRVHWYFRQFVDSLPEAEILSEIVK